MSLHSYGIGDRVSAGSVGVSEGDQLHRIARSAGTNGKLSIGEITDRAAQLMRQALSLLESG